MQKNYRKWNFSFLVFILMLVIFIFLVSTVLALTLILALAFGFTLVKSRFCFVAAMRDPWLTGMTELSRALILLLTLSIMGFALVANSNLGSQIMLYVSPIGLHTIVGGLLFGIGMVLAGGCAIGILMRVGEGFGMQMTALVGLFLGAALGSSNRTFWQAIGESPGIFIPDKLGWGLALAIELIVLLILWLLAGWWQKRKIGG